MADYETRWRNDQGYRRDDDRDRWRAAGRDGRSREEERGFGAGGYGEGQRGRQPGYGFEGPGREGYDYGRDYWRQDQDMGRGGSGSYGRGDYGRTQSHGRFGQGSGGGYEQQGDWRVSGGGYGEDFGTRGSYGGEGRDWWDRASDRVQSWFGDDATGHRHRMDEMRGGGHRGRGPRGYTRSDDRIREDVNDRLTDDAYVDASDIEVSVSGCEVTLNGTVDSRMVKRRAEDIAESVPGVRHVQNNLRVQQPSYAGSGTAAGASAMAGLGTGGATETAGAQTTTETSRTTTGTR
ncbi:MAG TPA: BON domain-containing protein [Azospirillum sp.]|nr:BON domain-containing protein [Azospirillum sp.]